MYNELIYLYNVPLGYTILNSSHRLSSITIIIMKLINNPEFTLYLIYID